MSLLKIARMGHPVLRQVATDIADPTDPTVRGLIADMAETLADIGGVGLAAPQIHVSLRAIIFMVPAERSTGRPLDQPQELMALINPVITPVGEDQELGWEGCLSIPGLRGAVPRWSRIVYRGLGLDGSVIEREVEGFHARVVQHEVDHLDGVLYPRTHAGSGAAYLYGRRRAISDRLGGLCGGGRVMMSGDCRDSNPRHSRESGNPGVAVPYSSPSGRPCRPPPDSRFRGNDERREMSASADDLDSQRDALLEATLPNVTFDGWSLAAMRAGAAQLGLGEGEIAALYPGGPGEMADRLDDWADRHMLDRLEAMDLAALKTRDRIAAGVMARLEILAPYREAVRRAIARRVGPAAPAAARSVWRTVDAIWYMAGDQATDFNFYSKRGLLAAAYAPTVLYWLNDRSEDMADTRAFLDRRLDGIMRLPKLSGSLRQAARRVTAPFEFLRAGRR